MTTAQSLDAPGCNTDDMFIVHGLFRSGFRDAPLVVRDVATGDGERVGVVAGHIRLLVGRLHGHHHIEDDLLWDQLEAKAPACALHIGLMRRQHAAMSDALDRAEAAAAAWEREPTAKNQGATAAALDEVNAHMREHFGDEEQLILPAASKAMSQREWNRLSERGRAEVDRSQMFIQLGYMLDSMTPEDARRFIREALPGYARLLYRVIGERQYRNYRKRVYGSLA